MNENNYNNLNNNNNGDNRQNGGGSFNPRNRQTIFVLIVATMVTLLGMGMMSRYVTQSTTREISYSEFLAMVSSNQI